MFRALIHETSNAFDKAGQILNKTAKTSKNKRIDITAVLNEEIDSARRKICAACSDSVFCPNFKHGFPQSAVMTLTRNLTLKGFLSENDIAGSPTEFCTRRTALSNEINRRETYRRTKQTQAEYAENIRASVSAQMTSYEELLSSLILPFEVNPRITAKIAETLRDIDPSAQISVSAGFRDNLFFADVLSDREISCAADKNNKNASKIIAEKLSAAAEIKLICSMHEVFGATHRYIYAQKPRYKSETAVSQMSAKRTNVNGDTVREFTNGFGTDFVIISDGMGHGQRAKVESAMTTSILTRLLKGGADPIAALKLTNILLRAKSASEMLSTVDLLCFNRYENTVRLIKSGASVTFVKTGEEICLYRSNTLPLGILTDFEADIFEFSVNPGDICVMLTDGIIENIYPKIKEIINTSELSPKESAERIIAEAENFAQMDVSPDDKTVVFIRFTD
jgi:stage II sporulation protein E